MRIPEELVLKVFFLIVNYHIKIAGEGCDDLLLNPKLFFYWIRIEIRESYFWKGKTEFETIFRQLSEGEKSKIITLLYNFYQEAKTTKHSNTVHHFLLKSIVR